MGIRKGERRGEDVIVVSWGWMKKEDKNEFLKKESDKKRESIFREKRRMNF